MERKKTKIVATLGPASREERVLQALIEAGMNVARLNLSHGTREEHRALLAGVRRAARPLGEAVAVMADTPGQAIRTGPVKDDRVSLQAGQRITLTEEPIVGDPQRIPVDFPGFSQCVRPDMEVLLANGDIRLKAIEVRPGEVVCEVVNSGTLGSRKRVNVPEAKIPVAAHDDEDLQFAAELGVEYLAASFVRTAEDIERVREGLGDRGIEVIAKIETREAVENIDEIIAASDGVMVARGDLGVELPMEEVPLIQKEIVRKSNYAGVPVIIATQMLKSMTENPRPTRAEVADVANAILDGADALMLSEETAVGRYPAEAVRVMSTVAGRIERSPDVYHKYHEDSTSVTEAIGESACQIAERIAAAAIIPSTTSGSTAKLVAKFRPRIPIVAVTYSETVRNKLALIWGVYPLLVESSDDTELMLRRSIEAVAREMQLPKRATVVITAGVPFGVPGTTNFIKVEHV
jgi:pyruvate kinase